MGGLFALRYRDRLHRILGFTAGVLLGVVAFDLFPEIHDLANETRSSFTAPMIALVVGFLAFHIVEKLVLIHSAHEDEYAPGRQHPQLGVVSAVALAVIAHDFSDGLNTVTLMLLNGNSSARSRWLLLLDASTPLLDASTPLFGAASRLTLLLTVAGTVLIFLVTRVRI